MSKGLVFGITLKRIVSSIEIFSVYQVVLVLQPSTILFYLALINLFSNYSRHFPGFAETKIHEKANIALCLLDMHCICLLAYAPTLATIQSKTYLWYCWFFPQVVNVTITNTLTMTTIYTSRKVADIKLLKNRRRKITYEAVNVQRLVQKTIHVLVFKMSLVLWLISSSLVFLILPKVSHYNKKCITNRKIHQKQKLIAMLFCWFIWNHETPKHVFAQ